MIVTANEYKSSVSRPCGVCRRELSSQGAVSTGMSSVDFASRKMHSKWPSGMSEQILYGRNCVIWVEAR